MDTRREKLNVNRQYGRRQRDFQTVVDWFLFVPDDSGYDELFDFSGPAGQHQYGEAVSIPVFFVVEEDGAEILEDGGRDIRKGVSFSLSSETFTARTHASIDPRARLNDMFRYEGKYYDVDLFDHKGLIGEPENDVAVAIHGFERIPGSSEPFDTDADVTPGAPFTFP